MFKIIRNIKSVLLNKTGILSTSIDFGKYDRKKVECSLDDISIIYENSTTNILELNQDGIISFIRPIRIHENIPSFVARIKNEFKKFILGSAKSNEYYYRDYPVPEIINVRRFMAMGRLNDSDSPLNTFAKSMDYGCIGLNTPRNAEEQRIWNRFVLFSANEIYSYNMNCNVKIGEYETYFPSRFISECIVGTILGCDSMFPKYEISEITIDGDMKILGLQIEAATGIINLQRGFDVDDSNFINDGMLRVLNSLNIIDVLCNEKDHKPTNYSIKIDDQGRAMGICAFDNDSENAFFINPGIGMRSYMGSSPICQQEMINRGCIDKTFVNRLNRTTPSDFNSLKPYMSQLQFVAFISRYKKMKRLLTKYECEIENAEVKEDALNDELDGKYGDTYIVILRKWIKGEYDSIIKKNENIVCGLIDKPVAG